MTRPADNARVVRLRPRSERLSAAYRSIGKQPYRVKPDWRMTEEEIDDAFRMFKANTIESPGGLLGRDGADGGKGPDSPLDDPGNEGPGKRGLRTQNPARRQ